MRLSSLEADLIMILDRFNDEVRGKVSLIDGRKEQHLTSDDLQWFAGEVSNAMDRAREQLIAYLKAQEKKDR